jgi:membrane-associated phospholipid phosphatase
MAKRLIFIFFILFFSFHGEMTRAALADDPIRIVDDLSPERVAIAQEISSSRPAAPECLFCLDYGKLVLSDTRHVLSAPRDWEKKEWLTFSLGALGVGVVALLDKPIFEAVQRHPDGSSKKMADLFEPFGGPYALGVLGIFYLDALAFDHPEATAVVQDGIAASIIGPGIIVSSIKLAVGRSRPNKNEGTGSFHPFGGNKSFPSGHSAEAFTIASVISTHYPLPWVQALSYGLAGLAGASRVVHNAHFASDVAAGALIGVAVGKSVVHFNNSGRTGLRVNPLLGPELRGLEVAFTF